VRGSLQPVLLVATAEDLMESEHAAWIDRMTETIRDAPSPPKARHRARYDKRATSDSTESPRPARSQVRGPRSDEQPPPSLPRLRSHRLPLPRCVRQVVGKV